MRRWLPLAALWLAGCAGRDSPAEEPPVLAIGLDAYRQWDRWAYLRIGQRSYMRSTYDRSGGNQAADASHFLRQDAPDRYLALDVEGSGVLSFVRTNHWHGSPWHYVVDGIDQVVSETNTADPDHPTAPAQLLPADLFPHPLTWTWPETHGADLNWVPMPFARSFSLAYGRAHYGTGYFIYSLFADGTPLAPWTPAPPPAEVLDLLARAGEDLAPPGDLVAGTLDVPAAGAVTVVDLAGPSTIRVLRFTVPEAAAQAFGRATIRITWDGRASPSVDAPIALFYGAGTLYNRERREFLVRALPAVVRSAGGQVELSMYFPMPFLRRAHLELVGAGDAVAGVAWHIRTQPYGDPPNHVGWFHASYRDHGAPTPGADLVLLDTTTVEGGGAWCGHFVGTSFIFSDAGDLGTLEGDPRFFFDDSETPQAQGTGSEEWGGGGDYWNGQTSTTPLAGHPVGAPNPGHAQGPEDLVESAYRFLLADLFPFGRNARIQLEHGGSDESTQHYRTVTYWYGTPSACLVVTDRLHVGDPADERAHDYASPNASPPESLTSRYELGTESPESSDTGRHTTGTSEFTLAVAPRNLGVLIRRKLDYRWPDQRALVYVAGGPGDLFTLAGTWYLAGSDSCVFAAPAEETGSDPPAIQTSNRRWRDDEFLIPRRLTAGRAAIRVRLVFDPAAKPLVAGTPPPASAWSEFRYTAYSYVMPAAP